MRERWETARGMVSMLLLLSIGIGGAVFLRLPDCLSREAERVVPSCGRSQ